MVNNPPANAGEEGQSWGQEDPLEKEMATHSSILAWEIPRKKGTWRATLDGVAEELDMISR